MKILAVGDIHLGRTPSRLPDELAGRARDLGPGEAWRRTVEFALREQVRAVLLAGDVVDRDDDFFEAYGALERGVRRLADDGIAVVGVAGNHDVEVLPKLARELPAFRLLGAEGRWESVDIRTSAGCGGDGDEGDGDGDGAGDDFGGLTIWGWSFPQRQVSDSPLATLPGERGKRLALGLLHCDRDATGGPYAPVASRELAAAGLDGWLLGHIHAPDALSADSPSGYLGSLSGLHRGETGVRGPWLMEVEGGRIESVEQVPLAPLRWARIDVDLEGIGEADDAKGRLIEALRAYDSNLAVELGIWPGTGGPNVVGVRLRLRGRSRFGTAAASALREEDLGQVFVGEGGVHYFVTDIDVETRPEIDLETLAARSDPPGLLAARLLLLDRPPGESPQRDALVAQARKRLRDEAIAARWQGLGLHVDPSGDDAAAWLRKAGWRALDKLLAQSADNTAGAG